MTQAQTFTGAVSGRVVDSQQAAITDASVTLRSVERGFERRTATNLQGEYAFELVSPGKFTVRAEASGFAATTVNVEVVVATPVRADLTLGVQSVKQEVTVLGENGVSVQTESASLGQIISSRQISELPSLTRNPYDFLAIMPGANLSNDGRGVGLAPYGLNGGGKSGGIALNGQRTVSGNFLLDGGENNDTFVAAPAQSVPLDSIAELSVQTNHYTAEYGRNAGFTANVITKSGTQQFHGSLYDYIRNSALAAGQSEKKTFSSLLRWSQSLCVAAPPIRFSCLRRSCSPSALREPRRSFRDILFQAICPPPMSSPPQFALMALPVIYRLRLGL